MKAPSNDANRPNPNAPGKGGDKVSGTGADATRPGAAGQPSAPGARPDPTKPAGPAAAEAGKIGPGKIEPGKVEPGKTEPGKPGVAPGLAGAATVPGAGAAGARTEPPKPATIPVEPAKPGTPAGAAPGAGAPKGEPPRPAPIGSGATGPGRPGETKPNETKPIDGKPNEAKPEDAKPADPKPGETKPGPGKAEPFRAGGTVTDGPILDLKAKRVPDPAEPPKGQAAAPGARTELGKTEPGKVEPGTNAPKDAAKPASATSPVPKAAAVSEPARGGAGFGSLAAAGLLGGVIGAGLLFGADRAGVLGTREDGRVAALEQRIAGLAPRDALTALDKRVAGNEATLKPLPDAVRSVEATAKQAIAQAGQQGAAPAEGGQTAPTAAPALPADLVARLDSLDQRVAALQEEPGKDGQAEVQAVPNLAALTDRVKALEERGGAPQQADLAPKLAAIQTEIESRTKANEEADRTLGQRLDTLQENLDARVKSATESVEKATQASQQAAEAGRTQAQEATRTLERAQQEQAGRIAALDKALGQRAEAATVQAALRVVAADRVATALATGTPFAEPLATLRKLETGDAARLDALAPFAESGAPGTAQLAAEFRPVAEKAAAARRAAEARSVAESGDIKTKLLSMADSIVQVRRVDAPPAASGQPAAEDPVAKVQAALDRGALQDAATAFEALPQEAKAEAGAFGERLKARNAAAQAARGLLSDAFKTLPTGP